MLALLITSVTLVPSTHSRALALVTRVLWHPQSSSLVPTVLTQEMIPQLVLVIAMLVGRVTTVHLLLHRTMISQFHAPRALTVPQQVSHLKPSVQIAPQVWFALTLVKELWRLVWSANLVALAPPSHSLLELTLAPQANTLTQCLSLAHCRVAQLAPMATYVQRVPTLFTCQ